MTDPAYIDTLIWHLTHHVNQESQDEARAAIRALRADIIADAVRQARELIEWTEMAPLAVDVAIGIRNKCYSILARAPAAPPKEHKE